MEEQEWGNVRVRASLKKEMEEFVSNNPQYGNVSNFVAFLINRELEK
jgi:hypothetical protein